MKMDKVNTLVLVTGGARSGKSSFAEERVLRSASKPFYIATCPVLDEEMRKRIERHQQLRARKGFTTIEEELDLAGALQKAMETGADGILVDCLTLWINNLLYHDPGFDETKMRRTVETLLVTLKKFPGTVVLVINEVGLGLVPENALGRTFRDCSGRCSQMIAAAAQEVWFCVCGIAKNWKE